MSYIEKEKLIKADIASIENRVRHAFNQGYDLGYKEGKERAKSQKSVLDKLRTEIEIKYGQCQLTEYIVQYDGVCTGRNDIGDIADILQIIDKYKGEIGE